VEACCWGRRWLRTFSGVAGIHDVALECRDQRVPQLVLREVFRKGQEFVKPTCARHNEWGGVQNDVVGGSDRVDFGDQASVVTVCSGGKMGPGSIQLVRSCPMFRVESRGRRLLGCLREPWDARESCGVPGRPRDKQRLMVDRPTVTTC
jgi:hypothetical protein